MAGSGNVYPLGGSSYSEFSMVPASVPGQICALPDFSDSNKFSASAGDGRHNGQCRDSVQGSVRVSSDCRKYCAGTASSCFLCFLEFRADVSASGTALEYDFSGKTIIPFTVHGGSGLSRTVRTIQERQPGATVVEDGLSISRNSVEDARSDVEDWIAGLDITS